MNRRKTIILILGLLLLGGGLWLERSRSRKPSEAAARSITVKEGTIEDTVEATGSVSPLNRVEIKPPISGRVEQLLVEEGGRLKAGQLMAWMSSTDRAAILDAARAQGPGELAKWQDAYKPTPIFAPLSGVVILRNVVVGQTVDPSAVLFAMSDTLIVLGGVDESDIGRVHLGMPARITLDSYPDQPVNGKVFDILYEGKNVSNVITYGVKIKTDATPPFFRSQMTANISFIVSHKDGAALLPASAVRESSDGRKQVLVPGPNGKPEKRDVETGIESGGKVEVLSGVSVGDPVLLRQGNYVPQQGPQTSPLSGPSGRPAGGNSGQGGGRSKRGS